MRGFFNHLFSTTSLNSFLFDLKFRGHFKIQSSIPGQGLNPGPTAPAPKQASNQPRFIPSPSPKASPRAQGFTTLPNKRVVFGSTGSLNTSGNSLQQPPLNPAVRNPGFGSTGSLNKGGGGSFGSQQKLKGGGGGGQNPGFVITDMLR